MQELLGRELTSIFSVVVSCRGGALPPRMPYVESGFGA